MRTLTTAFSFVLLFSLCCSSCKKDKGVQPVNRLTGSWQETGLNGLNRGLKFTKDNSFHLSLGNDDGTGTLFSGTYQVKGDSLKVLISEMVVQELGKPAQQTDSDIQLYEQATFSIAGDTLTLNYITYPADGPVATTSKFRRMVTIDDGGIDSDKL